MDRLDHRLMSTRHTLATLALSVAVSSGFGAISYTTPDTAVSQNFDTLASSGTGNAWTNDTTLVGWSLFTKDGNAIAAYNAGDGASNAGNFYSFGSAGSTERALGGVASGGAYFGSPPAGTLAGYVSLALTNNTGAQLESFTVSYAGEQWRNGGNATAQTMAAEWGIGGTFGTVTTWTALPAGASFVSPVATATAAAVDGNAAGRVTGLGASVNATWATGETLWIRWIENNDAGNDHGLAIDDLTFSASATPVPEPASAVFAVLSVAALGLRRRRK